MANKITKSLNDIDDQYIESAHKTFKFNQIINFHNFGKLSLICISLFIVINICSNLLISKEASSQDASYISKGLEIYDNSYSSNDVDTVSLNNSDDNTKLIINASMNIESSKFQQTVQDILNSLSAINGYSQSTNEYSNNYNRSFEATFRIPSENYSAFIEEIKEKYNVSYYCENVQDITSEYQDLNARLISLKAEETKIIEFYNQAKDLDDLLSIESYLSDLRYQIESIEKQIKNDDFLTSYATLDININETIVSKNNVKFINRISESFINGYQNFISIIEEIILFIVYHFIIFVFLIIILLVILFIHHKKNK